MSILNEQLTETQDFMREHFPKLLPAVDKAVGDIILLYEQAGCPFGSSPSVEEMREKAVEWFEGELGMWRQARDEEGIQARLDHFMQELRMIGDRENIEGRERETPKGIARHTVACLSVLVEHADTENRPLTDFEQFTLEYQLGTAYAAVVSYREQKGVI